MVYTVTLNPAIDYVLKTDKLRFNDINRSYSEKIYYGGKGINVSAVLSTLGIDTTALGFLGGFTGKKIEDMLKDDGIRCDFLYLSEGDSRINVKIKAETEIDINADGPKVKKEEINLLTEKLSSLSDGDFLVLAGSVPKSMPDGIYESILQRVDGKNIKCIVDATGELLKSVLKYKPFLVKPNHHELGELFGIEIKTEYDTVKYARELQRMGPQNVLVSCAKEGAVLVDADGGCHRVSNATGKLLNSVGCGDSMVAGFIAGYIRKQEYLHALYLGSVCGNATAFCEGLATAEEIEKILNSDITVTEINIVNDKE